MVGVAPCYQPGSIQGAFADQTNQIEFIMLQNEDQINEILDFWEQFTDVFEVWNSSLPIIVTPAITKATTTHTTNANKPTISNDYIMTTSHGLLPSHFHRHH